jgi:hypothetical protein
MFRVTALSKLKQRKAWHIASALKSILKRLYTNQIITKAFK